ncbi:hypothetical protein HQN87_05180 [Paenibacillus tritici]|uniref:Uncharacterized protein n=1 Tax=Paenibacillus tritici TaxID=1873425 RepID=A0ABX2DKY5_9BACL|nr:hypothetical protein [Paenibacillus tritici]NQX44718.1 hypothetical protein [Paenibacillus tritici]QUL53763.1 hypothetical protein KDC22_25925 [Paenibacillus tritici]
MQPSIGWTTPFLTLPIPAAAVTATTAMLQFLADEKATHDQKSRAAILQ